MPFCLNNQEQMMIMLNCSVWQIQGFWSKLDDFKVFMNICAITVFYTKFNCSAAIYSTDFNFTCRKKNLNDHSGELAKSIAQNVANCISWSKVCCERFFCFVLFFAYQSTLYLSTAHVKYVFITVHQTVTWVEPYWWLFTRALVHRISTVVKY